MTDGEAVRYSRRDPASTALEADARGSTHVSRSWLAGLTRESVYRSLALRLPRGG